ncbi:hypothetical protein XENOCAPTIV_015985 [Xenoophorus captivus]|uniref:Mediator of RNA polymerase II transcription subunit 15 n=1 Tax=Xenoophorus captivus TaxID=1517983 RepID=A0ABV0RAV9_9TELE
MQGPSYGSRSCNVLSKSDQQGAEAFISANICRTPPLSPQRKEETTTQSPEKRTQFWINSAMEVPGADSDWRSPQFRQKVVAQIEDAMRKAGSGNTTHKSGTDMESHVFIKAKTREEYLSLVARLIIHFRDIHKKALGGPDPMNALTNLTGVGGGPGAIGMGPRPPGAAVGGMGQMQIGQHAMAGVSGNPQAKIPTKKILPLEPGLRYTFKVLQIQTNLRTAADV